MKKQHYQHRRERKAPPPPRFTNRISDHFSKKDFVCNCGACEESIKVSLGLIGGLELLRSLVKNRITVKCGYMCGDAAEKQSLIKRNFHLVGVAADIEVENMSLPEVFKIAETIPEFKGIGLNLEDGHVHVDTRKADERELWIEEGAVNMLLTDELRAKYLG